MANIRKPIHSVPELKECQDLADGWVEGGRSCVEGKAFADCAVGLESFGEEGVFGCVFWEAGVCGRGFVEGVVYMDAAPGNGFEV